MISIITPIYNASQHLSSSIISIYNQFYTEWELLLINDGSKDNSKEVALSFKDPRIRYFEQENKGVSAARNLGLAHMKGDYFCFLDADDVLPVNSLESRLKIFEENPSLTFVDGSVAFMDENLVNPLRLYTPSCTGNPLPELLQLNGSCFSSLSWMIKRTKANTHIRMNEKITHGEDLLYYLELARQGGLYGYTNQVVLQYRQHPQSAMRNLEALEKGYWQIYDYIKDWEEFTPEIKRTFRFKVKKFMILDYLKRGKLGKTFSTFIK